MVFAAEASSRRRGMKLIDVLKKFVSTCRESLDSQAMTVKSGSLRLSHFGS